VPIKRPKVIAVAMAVQREQQHPSDNRPWPRTRRMSTATCLHQPAYCAHTTSPSLLLAMLLLLRPFIVSSSTHLIINLGPSSEATSAHVNSFSYCHLARPASILRTYVFTIASASNLTQLDAPPVCKV
jgi:hypothetical protein